MFCLCLHLSPLMYDKSMLECVAEGQHEKKLIMYSCYEQIEQGL